MTIRMEHNKIFERIVEYLKITKPLIFFDIKATGPALSIDRIIEIAYIKVMPNGRAISESILINPETDMSEEAAQFHNITNEELFIKLPFRKRASEIWGIFNNCFFAGFNIINFDLPLLRREFARVGMDFDYVTDDVIDSKSIFTYLEPNTLSVIYRYYMNQEHLGSNKAMRDVEAALEIFNKQFEKYREVRDQDFLKEIYKTSDDRLRGHERKFYWREGEAYFNFSKYQDTPLSEVARFDQEYLEWMLQADFSKEIKSVVRFALEKEKKPKA